MAVLDNLLRALFGKSGGDRFEEATFTCSGERWLIEGADSSPSASDDHRRLERLRTLPSLPRELLEYALWNSVSESSMEGVVGDEAFARNIDWRREDVDGAV